MFPEDEIVGLSVISDLRPLRIPLTYTLALPTTAGASLQRRRRQVHQSHGRRGRAQVSQSTRLHHCETGRDQGARLRAGPRCQEAVAERHSTAIFATVHSHGGGKPVTDSRGDQRRMLTISDAQKLLEGRTVRGLTATKEDREWVSLLF